MAQQQSRLFASEPGDHDVEQAEELMEKGEIQAGLCLRRRAVSGSGGTTADAGDARRSQKQASMGVKGGGPRGVDDDFGCRVALWDIDDALSSFAPQSTVFPDQGSSLKLVS